MGTGQKMGMSFPKVLRNSSMGTGQKMECLFKKVLRNSSMCTGQKMGMSFPKGIKKFVNGYRVKNGNFFSKRYYEIRQWVQGKKWEPLFQKILRNSSMGTG